MTTNLKKKRCMIWPTFKVYQWIGENRWLQVKQICKGSKKKNKLGFKQYVAIARAPRTERMIILIISALYIWSNYKNSCVFWHSIGNFWPYFLYDMVKRGKNALFDTQISLILGVFSEKNDEFHWIWYDWDFMLIIHFFVAVFSAVRASYPEVTLISPRANMILGSPSSLKNFKVLLYSHIVYGWLLASSLIYVAIFGGMLCSKFTSRDSYVI